MTHNLDSRESHNGKNRLEKHLECGNGSNGNV
jgi:hypothetical protein